MANRIEGSIGEFEELVLISIDGLGEEAYGVPIRRHLEGAGRRVSVGGLYVTMERLERKGLVMSWTGGATRERGGRAKRYYRLTGEGRRSLAKAEEVRVRARQKVRRREHGVGWPLQVDGLQGGAA